MKNHSTPHSKILINMRLISKKIIISVFIISLYVLTSSTSYAQVQYIDINPDAYLTGEDSLVIDINQDEVVDFVIYCGYTDIMVNSTYFKIAGREHSSIALTNDSVSAIMINQTIDESLQWVTNERKTIFNWDAILEMSYGNWANIAKGFVGLRILIDGEYHYAWLRLHKGSNAVMWGVDFAINNTGNAPILAGEEMPTNAASLNVKDKSDYFDGRDIDITFTSAYDENAISEYRIIVAKADDQSALDIAEMNIVPESRYFSILVTPSAISFIRNIVLLETTVDKNGDLIDKFVDYKVHILNIASSGNSADNSLTIPSDIINLQSYPKSVNKPRAFDLGNSNTASDIQLTFISDPEQQFVNEYRVFIIPIDTTEGFTTEYALSLSEERYVVVNIGDSLNSIQIQESQKDINGNDIIGNTGYFVSILSVADSVYSITSPLSSFSRKFYLKNPNSFFAGQEEGGDIQFFECDSVFGPYPYWNGVNGNHGSADFNIDLNRDGIPDFFIEGSNYSSSGGTVTRRALLTPLRNNKVLICDHPEHENWIDPLDYQEAIDESYHWYNGESILVKYRATISGVIYNYGHKLKNTYYIGLYLADNDPPQFAWLKMNGGKFKEYAFIDIISGTNELKPENNFNIFPNPATNIVQIHSSISLSVSQDISISVFNNMGSIIEEFQINDHNITKNISQYSAGLYLFVIKDRNGVLETHRIIKE